jgi:hypothetical protein
MTGNLQDLLTWWESDDDKLRVECFRYKGAYRVRTLRYGYTSATRDAKTETEARQAFERTVEKLGTSAS